MDAEAYCEDKLVGYICLRNNYIDDICVDEDYFHQGIAQRLIRAACEKLKEKHTKIALDVRAYNEPAINCYKKLGFKILRKRIDFYNCKYCILIA